MRVRGDESESPEKHTERITHEEAVVGLHALFGVAPEYAFAAMLAAIPRQDLPGVVGALLMLSDDEVARKAPAVGE